MIASIAMVMETQMIERARQLASATLADALDALGILGIMSGIPRQSGSGRIVGFARTMQEQTAAHGSYPFDDFSVGRGFDAVGEGEVLMVDMAGADVSTFGGLAANVLHRNNAAGAVIDGGCRDIEEIQAVGMTVAARFRTPRSGKGRARVVSVDQPISCGGVEVRLGDLVVIDDTGIVVLPREKALDVLALAEELDARDRSFLQQLHEGKSFADVSASLRHA